MRAPPATSSSPVLWVAGIAALLATFVLLAWPALTRVPFYTKGEPREALVVQSIVAGEGIVLPPRNGSELPSKPILFHWFGAVASLLDGGVKEASVRAPSLLASLATLAATAAIGWQWAGPATALASAVVLATCLQWLASSATARVDMLLAANISLALFCFAWAYERRRPIPALAYAFVTAATLTKGPVGLILPSIVVVVFLALRGELGRLTLRDARCLLVAAGVAGLWYLAAFVVGGDAFLAKQILKENLYRVLDPDSVEAGHVRPFWYYAPLLLAGAAPWSLFLPSLGVALWKRRAEVFAGPMLLALVWLVTTAAVFSLAGSKRSVYLLPAYPALALLVGHAWLLLEEASDPPTPSLDRALRVSLVVAVGTLALLTGALAVVLMAHLAGAPVAALFDSVLSETDNANVPAVLAAIDEHAGLVIAWAATVLGVVVAITALLQRRRPRAVLAAVALLVLATAALTSTTLLPALASRRSSQALLARAASVLPDNAALSFFGGIDYGAVFYRGSPIPSVDRLEALPEIDGAWLLTWRARMPDLAAQAQKLTIGDETAATYAVEEILGDDQVQTSLLLVRIVRRP